MKSNHWVLFISLFIIGCGGCANMFNTNSTSETSSYIKEWDKVKDRYSDLIGKNKDVVLTQLGNPVNIAKEPSVKRLPGNPDEIWSYRGLDKTDHVFVFYFKDGVLIKIDW